MLSIINSDTHLMKQFRGIFAADTLPTRNTKRPSGYICNLDPSYKSGSHWVCFYFPSKGLPEYFDSFGFPPLQSQFDQFLGRKFKFNKRFIQYPLSAVCGQYCIYYLWKRSKCISMETLLADFDWNQLLFNDMFVNKEIENNFSVDLDVFDWTFVNNQISQTYKQIELMYY